MARPIFKDSISPTTAAVLAFSVFLGAFTVGGGVRLLHEAAGRNFGANAVLWTGLLFLAIYAWRAVARYRRIRRATPADITERLARLAPANVAAQRPETQASAPPVEDSDPPAENEESEAPVEESTETPPDERRSG